MKFKIALFLIVFTVSLSFAQMGMGNGMGNGMNRGMGNQMPQPNPPPAKKIDYLAVTLDKLTKELTLDTFQSTVLKGYLEEQKKKEDLVFAEDIIDQAKMDKIQVLREKFDKKLISLLGKEQIDKYTKMKDGYKKK